jgi:hypothetical protein
MIRFRILKNGILVFFAIGIFFLFLEFTGLSDIAFLRFFNAVFIILGVNATIKSGATGGNRNYFQNFGAGILTSFIGVFLSIIGLAIYIGIIKGVDHLDVLAHSIMFGKANSLFQFCAVLFIEGLASSVTIAFIIMQRWKNYKVKFTKVA